MKPILEIRNIGKKYRISHEIAGYLSLRERMMEIFRRQDRSKEDFWALNHVSFDVKRGESVGIIGRNGAGKSTLLKILSRITPPTTGRITARGRIASLLEVGTGFHPELTGRENVYLNGSLLGMKRRVIHARFDEIVDFSGVERFLDTPLKHFSSGMQLRLAFAVAAFLEPEILVIDEVLAVGDAEFQKKCIGKMEDVSKSGRTVLFVSHNLSAVARLCTRSILLSGGEIVSSGTTGHVLEKYTSGSDHLNITGACEDFRLNNDVKIRSLELSDPVIDIFSNVELFAVFESRSENLVSSLCVLFYSALGERVAIVDLRSEALTTRSKSSRVLEVKIQIRDVPLLEGEYYLGLYIESNLCTGNHLDLIKLTVRRGPQIRADPYPAQVRGWIELRNQFEIK